MVWLLYICEVITPTLLLPLMGPEELDLDDKKGMDRSWLVVRGTRSTTWYWFCHQIVLCWINITLYWHRDDKIEQKNPNSTNLYRLTTMWHGRTLCRSQWSNPWMCQFLTTRWRRFVWRFLSDHQIYNSIDNDATTDNTNNANNYFTGLLTADPSISI